MAQISTGPLKMENHERQSSSSSSMTILKRGKMFLRGQKTRSMFLLFSKKTCLGHDIKGSGGEREWMSV